MLTYRRRGKTGHFHVRGTVQYGEKKRYVKEHSTGLGTEEAVKGYVTDLAARIRKELALGRAGRATDVRFFEVLHSYVDRPEGLHPNDAWRMGELNEVMADYAIADILEGWVEFKKVRCKTLAPATVGRFRDTLQAALNHAAGELHFDAPRIPPIRFKNERLRWLTVAHADRLIASYVAHVRPIALVFRYQGARTQEVLQLEWPNVDLARETLFFERTKNAQPRTVKMHPRVAKAVKAIWRERDKPEEGHVFLNRLGRPYADTRDYAMPGGNPLSKAHQTALKVAKLRPNGGPGFTVHDWRHHWASWCVMSGIDLVTIQKMGGWKDFRMVQRYAAVSDDHMDEAVRKLRSA